MAKAQGTWPLRIAESLVLRVVAGTCMLVEMAWLCLADNLAVMFYADGAMIGLLVCMDQRSISLLASLAYTYPLSLGKPESHNFCK